MRQDYSFRLPDVRISVGPRRRPRGFRAVVASEGGEVLGQGEAETEAGAVGLAILAAREAFAVCNGCGLTFYRDDMDADIMGYLYCGDCAWARIIPERGDHER
jgi:hypothetical protein